MSRLDEIVEMLQRRESMFGEDKMEELIQWMGTLTDEEVVELLQTAATELAWRAIGGHTSGTYPSNEVFHEATKRIAKVFFEETRKRNAPGS